MFMRFSLYPGSATTNPVLAFCNASSKVFFWDLARLEEYYDYITNINTSVAPDSTSTAVNPGHTAASMQDVKRPPFLVPYKHRNRGVVTALHRLARETSPVDSASTDSSSHKNAHLPPNHDADPSADAPPRSHPAAGAHQPVIPGLTPSDSAKSLEIWAKRYSIGDPHGDIIAHKDEVVKGFEFVGRYIAWSNGGEWCVVVGSAGMIGIFERWQK
jgi:polycomb protein EED